MNYSSKNQINFIKKNFLIILNLAICFSSCGKRPTADFPDNHAKGFVRQRWAGKLTLFSCTILVLILLVSCRYSRLPKNLTLPTNLCYSEERVKSKSILRMDGFYLNKVKVVNEEGAFGSNENRAFDSAYIYTAEIYYQNGLWVNFYSGYEMFKNGKSLFNVLDTLKLFLKSVNYPKKNKFFYTDNYWGTYVIKNDTLIKYKINHPRLLDGFWTPGLHKDYIIENKIIPVSYSNLKVTEGDNRKTTFKEYNLIESEVKTLVFEPFYPLPDSKFAWILKKKVFWCNEEEYKRWKTTYKN